MLTPSDYARQSTGVITRHDRMSRGIPLLLPDGRQAAITAGPLMACLLARADRTSRPAKVVMGTPENDTSPHLDAGTHTAGRPRRPQPRPSRRPRHPQQTAEVNPPAATAATRLAAPDDDLPSTLMRTGMQLVWAMPAGGVITDPDLTWCKFTGQALEEARGAGWTEAVYPDDRARLRRAIASGLATEQPYETECRLWRADGVWRQMVVHVVPLQATDGRLREWVCVGTDVTEERASL